MDYYFAEHYTNRIFIFEKIDLNMVKSIIWNPIHFFFHIETLNFMDIHVLTINETYKKAFHKT